MKISVVLQYLSVVCWCRAVICNRSKPELASTSLYGTSLSQSDCKRIILDLYVQRGRLPWFHNWDARGLAYSDVAFSHLRPVAKAVGGVQGVWERRFSEIDDSCGKAKLFGIEQSAKK